MSLSLAHYIARRGEPGLLCRRGSTGGWEGGWLKASCVWLQLRNPIAGPRDAWFLWSTVMVVEMAGWYRRNVMS